ncbi:lactonase family protein [Terriglobus roseus]|uniref:6-phosphogluconolactonase n=1 Tax=Terriglobus roseus TaxID=392734 RepID=A0A1H4MKM2_9BACT|nr:lactonase family protein [Terriglobus roseus]SEB83397.1 6-phosphogluconolactonase [Terriglobus roseus]
MLTRRKFLGSAAAGAAMMLRTTTSSAREMAGTQRLFVGTSSQTEFTGHGEGIFVTSFRDGRLGSPRLLAKVTSPSFLAVPQAGHPLFAVLGGDDGASRAASYAISQGHDVATTTLTPIDTASSGGGGGCHVSASPDGRCVFVSNYGGGSVASFHADSSGKLTQASVIRFPPTEHGPVQDRQEGSHVHSAMVSPDGAFVLVNDFGLDRIHVFGLDRATAKLTPHRPDHWLSEPGSGPRHLVFHPNGRWIYCICELNSTVVQLQWNATHGVLTPKSVAKTLPDGVDAAKARGCEMVFSKDMRFLYASNRRASESFAVFAVDASTGALTKIQNKPNPGLEARHIAVDPSGRWFLVANQFSGDVTVFALDMATGHIGEPVSKIEVSGASCLLFA